MPCRGCSDRFCARGPLSPGPVQGLPSAYRDTTHVKAHGERHRLSVDQLNRALFFPFPACGKSRYLALQSDVLQRPSPHSLWGSDSSCSKDMSEWGYWGVPEGRVSIGTCTVFVTQRHFQCLGATNGLLFPLSEVARENRRSRHSLMGTALCPDGSCMSTIRH